MSTKIVHFVIETIVASQKSCKVSAWPSKIGKNIKRCDLCSFIDQSSLNSLGFGLQRAKIALAECSHPLAHTSACKRSTT